MSTITHMPLTNDVYRSVEFPDELEINGRKVEFWVESGIVAGVRRLSETHVSGQVSQGSGHISSTTYRTTEFAVIADDGRERPHWFNSHDAYLRDGHRISLLHAGCRRQNWCYLRNHSSRETFRPWKGAAFVFELGLVRRVGWLWFVAAVIGLVVLGNMLPAESTLVSPSTFWGVLGGLLAFKVFQWWRAHRTFKQHVAPKFYEMLEDLKRCETSCSLPA